ncbi:MAG: trypsin-like peptidase domain-containing protein [Planctomycetota bacterium]
MKYHGSFLIALGLVAGFFVGRFGLSQSAPLPVDRTPIPTELLPEEGRAIEVFRNSVNSVVYITNYTLARDRFSLNLYTIPSGSGSGFVWDRQGHIVTNYHVVRPTDASREERIGREVLVTLSDQSDWTGHVVGAAPEKDLAVVKIDAPPEKLVPLEPARSRVLVGQTVYAIGNPFGLDHSLSSGVVSALGREIEGDDGVLIRDLIQTDAAINPGNSGGPLLNSSGQVIGINTAIYSPTRASIGIGFAVPMEIAAGYIPQLVEHGRIIRPVIGIYPGPTVTLGDEKGVMILEVLPGGPAARAGLVGYWQSRTRLGDVILSINDHRIESSADLFDTLEAYKPGDVVKVTFLRGSSKRSIDLELASPQ